MSANKMIIDTFTLPRELAADVAQMVADPAAFVAEAVRASLERLHNGNGDAPIEGREMTVAELANSGFEEWFNLVPDEEVEGLFDPSEITPLHWVPGVGLVEG